jgi:hypothetical protein
VDSVIKLRNLSRGGILRVLAETPENREMRVEIAERKKTDLNILKVLIDNVALAMK